MPEEHSFSQSLTRHYLLEVPEGQGPHPLLICCHGYSQRGASMMRFVQLWGKEYAIASLQGPFPHHRSRPPGVNRRPYGFGWISSWQPEEAITLHNDALCQLIDHLVATGVADGTKIVLVGYSQSVSLNYRFAFSGARPLAGIIALMGGLPSAFDTMNCDSPVPILMVGATDDVHYPPEKIREFARLLEQRNLEPRLLWHQGVHELPLPLVDELSQWVRECISGNLFKP